MPLSVTAPFRDGGHHESALRKCSSTSLPARAFAVSSRTRGPRRAPFLRAQGWEPGLHLDGGGVPNGRLSSATGRALSEVAPVAVQAVRDLFFLRRSKHHVFCNSTSPPARAFALSSRTRGPLTRRLSASPLFPIARWEIPAAE